MTERGGRVYCLQPVTARRSRRQQCPPPCRRRTLQGEVTAGFSSGRLPVTDKDHDIGDDARDTKGGEEDRGDAFVDDERLPQLGVYDERPPQLDAGPMAMLPAVSLSASVARQSLPAPRGDNQ
ncbi:hypothetical protein C0Q70_14139 [Pomacea canaliculata]|uniref:Uncharacterized protein n=1 Tax=Pomacea canaliculata TaxID=400727 RepID=A0A2T7NZ65_POMCA|nr:hypothetical protein C0Q70_14139 [Pomacea canaliculata]